MIARIQFVAVGFCLLLLGAAAIGYIVAPASMLSVVGIDSSPTSDFLVRTVAAAFIGMLPAAWAVLRRTGSALERVILWGLATYMVVGSAVDLLAYSAGIVGPAAVPSVIVRVVLAIVLAWLAVTRRD
jgi:hypothetical protein